ncbi:MAG: MBL fold metallo-hydrolase [Deltaproteobacteria bacterium]|nr:MBL fold metallo-hydrolase [Deltaproteobacteria bacterium]
MKNSIANIRNMQAGFVKPLLLIIVAVLIIAGIYLAINQGARKGLKEKAMLKTAEIVGKIAAKGMESASDLMSIPVEVHRMNDFIYRASGIADVYLIATTDGNVVFDTGLVTQAALQLRLLKKAAPENRLSYIVLSHSHADHIGGFKFWAEDGVPVIAHRAFLENQRFQKELVPYLWNRNRTLYPFIPKKPQMKGMFAYGGVEPTILVDDYTVYRFKLGGIRFEVIPTPGAEGDDNLCLWLPDQKILFAGDTLGPLFPQFPNIFCMRGEKIRKPIEYIRSLNRIIELEPEMILAGHFVSVEGNEKIRADLIRIRDAVQYVHDAVIAGMNVGKTVYQLMEEINLPPGLELTQVHGRVSRAVRSMWEYYTTWFHFDSTTELFPVPARYIYGELNELAGSEKLVRKAREHLEKNQPVHALHFLEIALAGNPDSRPALEARMGALNMLLTQAKEGFRNTYEIMWLKYRIRDTEEKLQGKS